MSWFVGSRALFRVPASIFVAVRLVMFRPFPKKPTPAADDAVTLAVVVILPVDVKFPVTLVVVPAGAVSTPPTYDIPDTASCDALTLPLMVAVASVVAPFAFRVPAMSWFVGRRALFRVPASIFVAVRLVMFLPFPKNPRPTPELAVTLAVVVMLPVAVRLPPTYAFPVTEICAALTFDANVATPPW